MYKAYVMPHPPLIIPGIGNGNEVRATRHSCSQIANDIKSYNPDTIVLISPHSIMYEDYIHISPGKTASGDFEKFGMKQIKMSVNYDAELAKLIAKEAEKDGVRAGELGEKNPSLDHGVMVPLHFIGTDIKIVRISISGLSFIEHYRFGMCIQKAAQALSRRIVIVASGDMSHKLSADGPYGYSVEGEKHDNFVRKCIEEADFQRLISLDISICQRAAECGFRSILILAGALDGFKVQSKLLSYEYPFGVGYLTACFSAKDRSESILQKILDEKNLKFLNIRNNEDSYVQLARKNIEKFVLTGKTIDLPLNLPNEMTSERAGTFVSIKKDGNLRGCIGTIEATEKNIALEIIKNSISAAVNDYRFDPIEPSELEELVYSVDILSLPQSIDTLDMLDVNKYGVIVTSGNRRGLLLPNLEGIETVSQQVSVALQKAGIKQDEPYAMQRFKVVRHF